MRLQFALLAALFSCIANTYAETKPKDIWDMKRLSKAPAFQWHTDSGPIRQLFYNNEPYKGQPTRVFALYASPETLGQKVKGPYPAMVLVHGGGGKAFDKWVRLYAERGYAAIAMSLGGQGPDGKKHHAAAGPGQGHEEKLYDETLAEQDMWTYHAVSAVVRAHSLIRSFKEVDAERTGVTGISWGGYLTCIVAGVDLRFKAASPQYGCGFLHENSAWKAKMHSKMSPAWRKQWIRLWDPSSHIGRTTMPMLFVNGSNDFAYPLDSYDKTYDLVRTPKNISIQPGMKHGHIFEIKEIFAFLDHHLKGAPPLHRVRSVHRSGDKIAATVSGPGQIKMARIHYTSEPHANNLKRKWTSKTLAVSPILATGYQEARGDVPPKGTTAWYVTVTSEKGLLVSSEVQLP
jgi:dienelactone hydrolase